MNTAPITSELRRTMAREGFDPASVIHGMEVGIQIAVDALKDAAPSKTRQEIRTELEQLWATMRPELNQIAAQMRHDAELEMVEQRR